MQILFKKKSSRKGGFVCLWKKKSHPDGFNVRVGGVSQRSFYHRAIQCAGTIASNASKEWTSGSASGESGRRIRFCLRRNRFGRRVHGDRLPRVLNRFSLGLVADIDIIGDYNALRITHFQEVLAKHHASTSACLLFPSRSPTRMAVTCPSICLVFQFSTSPDCPGQGYDFASVVILERIGQEPVEVWYSG